MRNKRLQAMAEGAVLLALALVFNALKLFKLPNGGSVDLAMIPVFSCLRCAGEWAGACWRASSSGSCRCS